MYIFVSPITMYPRKSYQNKGEQTQICSQHRDS